MSYFFPRSNGFTYVLGEGALPEREGEVNSIRPVKYLEKHHKENDKNVCKSHSSPRVILTTFSPGYTFSKKCSLVLVNLSRTRLHYELTRLHVLPDYIFIAFRSNNVVNKLDFHSELGLFK